MSNRKYETIEARLLANSVRADMVMPLHEAGERYYYAGSFCWLWIGARKPNGYGQIGTRFRSGPRKGKTKTENAHRVSVRVFKGRIVRKDYVIQHLCNNRACINPDHLQGGTQSSNIKQCVRDGRHRTPFAAPDAPNHVSQAVPA